MDVPCRAGRSLGQRRGPRAFGVLQVFIHRAGNDVEIQSLGPGRLVVHELAEALGRGVAQPFVDGQAITLRFTDLLPGIVQEQLIGQVDRRLGAQGAADLRGEPHAVDQVLAGHLVIHTQRVPAHRPIGLPLRLAMPGNNRGFKARARLVAPDQGAVSAHLLHRHLHDDSGDGVDGQEGRIGGAPVRSQGGQDDAADLVMDLAHPQQRGVEATLGVILGAGGEFVVETETVQEAAEAGVVMRAEAVMGAEWVGDAGQRAAQISQQQIAVGHIVRRLSQPVHVVTESQQARRHAGHRREGMANPRSAGDLAEGADMRQAGGAVAGLEQGVGLARSGQPVGEFGCFLDGPGFDGA